MSTLGRWLDGRAPAAPPELAERMREGLDPGSPVSTAVELLTEAAAANLAEARGRPGMNRASAFHLLAADALVTYACEAALETEDVEATLAAILDLGAAS